MGIDVSEIKKIVHVVQAIDEDYCTSKISMLYKTDLTAYRKEFAVEISLVEAFKNGTKVFMLTNP
jgi:hypothetical protein